MKKFETPDIQIIQFRVEDIITASDNMLPVAPIADLSKDELNIVSMD